MVFLGKLSIKSWQSQHELSETHISSLLGSWPVVVREERALARSVMT